MKIPLRAILLSIITVMLLYLGYLKRFEISALVWHWRNGGLVQVGDYKVPVPDRWLVKVEDSGLTFLINSRGERRGNTLSGINVITIDSLPTLSLIHI